MVDLTVNGTGPQARAGDYFLHRAPAGNQAGPVWNSATLVSGSQSVNTGTVVPAQTEGFSYDAAGNLTADGQWSYTYDALNRLIAMEGFHHPIGPGQSAIDGLPAERDVRLEFRYDEQNRRVEKTVRDRFSGTLKKRERFLYQGWNLVATLDATDLNNIQVVSQYFWRTGSEETGSFGLLMIAGDHDGDPSTARRAYYTGYDGRGNLTSLAGQTRGVAAAAFEYSPFGERLRTEGTEQLPDLEALGAHFGFATQYTDRETGLVYFGHRYYHPGHGRFLTRDPLGEAGGLNRYLYASNDPINFTDYRGLCDADPGESGFWGSLFGSIGGFVSGVIEGAFGVVGAAVHGVSTIVDGIGYALDFIGLDFLGDVFHAAADIGHAIGGAITSFGGALGSFVGSGIDMAIGGVESVIQGSESSLGDALRKIPIVGWALGSVGDTASGRIGHGIGSFVNVVGRDIAAGIIGTAGKVYVAGRDVIGMGGSLLSGDFKGFAGRFGAMIHHLVIPNYGWYGGAGWGTEQFGSDGSPSPLNVIDQASLAHDDALANGSGRAGDMHWQWVRDTWSDSGTAPGPIGQAYRLIGSAAFGLGGMLDNRQVGVP